MPFDLHLNKFLVIDSKWCDEIVKKLISYDPQHFWLSNKGLLSGNLSQTIFFARPFVVYGFSFVAALFGITSQFNHSAVLSVPNR